MTTFRVGQRVRIKNAQTLAGHFFVGKEAVVTKIDDDDRGTLYGLDISPIEEDENDIWGWTGDQLEPITDANTLVSWESMRDLWVPEHLRVAA